MMRRSKLVALLVGFLAVLALRQAVGAPEKPNIVYFVIDELGYYESSFMGHSELRTPNLDRLASEGTRFTQFLAGGNVCAPTRCTLLTGRHTGHATVRNNGGFDPLLPGEETIGSVLKRAGYATGGFGKWGNGGRGTSGVPEKHGFDVFFGYFPDILPTFAELAGAEVPKDVDGLSIVPELLGEQAAGRPQPQHRYLYWEDRNQAAVRMGDWKALRKGGETGAWELYDLSKDVSETTDVASQRADVLAQMKAFAAEAHRPMPAGEIYDRALLEKDRRYQPAGAEKPARQTNPNRKKKAQ